MIYIINTFLSNTFDFCFFLSVNVSGKHKNTTETNQRFSHQLQGTFYCKMMLVLFVKSQFYLF